MLSLYVSGEYTEEQIAAYTGYAVDGVHSIIGDTFRRFFPELQNLQGVAYTTRLRHAGRLYLEQYERRERLEADLRGKKLGEVVGDYQHLAASAGEVIAAFVKDLGPQRGMNYMRGRLCGLMFDYHRSERYLRTVSTITRPLHLAGLVLHDFANATGEVGNLSEGRQAAQASGRMYRELYDRSSTHDDAILMGEARALIQEQQLVCFSGDRDQCRRLHEEAKGVLEQMRTPDYYGWAKTYRFLGWCALIEGMARQDRQLLTEAATYMRVGYDYACQIRSNQSNYWWRFRDGGFLGGHWVKLVLSSCATDTFIQLKDFAQAEFYYNQNQSTLNHFIVRPWVRELPLLVPMYSWWFDVQKGLDPVAIGRQLAQRTQDATDLGLRSHGVFIQISYGDFAREHLTDNQGTPVLARRVYDEARAAAAHLKLRGLEQLAISRRETLAGPTWTRPKDRAS